MSFEPDYRFAPMPARVEDLNRLADRVNELEQRLRQLELRQEADDDTARERRERER